MNYQTALKTFVLGLFIFRVIFRENLSLKHNRVLHIKCSLSISFFCIFINY